MTRKKEFRAGRSSRNLEEPKTGSDLKRFLNQLSLRLHAGRFGQNWPLSHYVVAAPTSFKKVVAAQFVSESQPPLFVVLVLFVHVPLDYSTRVKF